MEQINQYFADYYKKNPHDPIYDWQHREFGYSPLPKTMKRHKNWDKDELNKLLQTGPADVYVSSSFYSNPTEKDKNWIHGNLIFDIDSKDLNLECYKEHGNLSCQKCIEACYEEYYKLQKIFTDLEIRNYTCYFSGNAGLHIECDKNDYNYIKPEKRFKLVKYILDSVKIDKMVTMDKSRIFRMPNTLSSKSGLLKMRSNFPYDHSAVLSRELIKFDGKYPKFYLDSNIWRGHKGEIMLPTNIAVYLSCKGYGDII